mmetsp:Transcript_129487/g.224964  ORF Transcript_129487/g.224964 Transcript_129487/m.224964 type:complete len:105 (+) Transcript_129487:1221-1535(+)
MVEIGGTGSPPAPLGLLTEALTEALPATLHDLLLPTSERCKRVKAADCAAAAAALDDARRATESFLLEGPRLRRDERAACGLLAPGSEDGSGVLSGSIAFLRAG